MSSDETRLALYRQAEEDILLGGQSSSVPGRSLTLGSLGEVQEMIRVLEARVSRSTSGPLLLSRGPRR